MMRSRGKSQERGVVSGYFKGWWARKSPVVLALVDDLVLYACFLLFVTIMHFVLNFADAHFGFDAGLHQLIHKWGFLTCDLAIVLGLVRKLLVTLVLSPHD